MGGWGGARTAAGSPFRKSCKNDIVFFVTPGGPRPVLRDVRRLLLQRHRQHHQHPSGGGGHGGDGVQEAGAAEVQPPDCGQRRLLRDR